jgi:glycosyltransferase involved in cell wall biosynthesis
MRIAIDLQSCQTVSADRGIGRYSLALAQALARNSGDHEIWLALNGHFPDSILELRRIFDPLIPRQRMQVFCTPAPVGQVDPTNAWRVRTAEFLREDFLASLHPDIVHISSLFEGQGDKAVTSAGTVHSAERTSVTLYDLIPLMHAERFLSDQSVQRWYYRKLQSLKNCGLALAISQASRLEALDALGLPAEQVVNISGAAAPLFQRICLSPDERSALLSSLGIMRPFIMCMGTAELHKNLERMFEAFALISAPIRQSYQLLIICVHEESFPRYRTLCKRLGLAPDEVVFVRRVSDDNLLRLYNIAALFVLPSLHEGFGLPALEAMSCGAPTIGSNCTSIPEVIDRRDALFDPRSATSIADKMIEVLANETFRRSLGEYGPRRARAFSWDFSAKLALDAFEALHAQKTEVPRPNLLTAHARPRLAYVAPLPPVDTDGVGAGILSELGRHYAVDLISEQPTTSDPWLAANFALRRPDQFEADADQYDRILYEISGNTAYAFVLELLSRHPGTVLLREPFLGRLISDAEATGRLPAGTFIAALFRSHGYPALVRLAREGRQACLDAYPTSLDVIDRAAGVIVPSPGMLELVEKWFGSDATEYWVCVPPVQSAAVGAGGDERRTRNRVIARLYREAIERFALEHPIRQRERLIAEIAELECGISPADSDIMNAASCLTRNAPSIRRTLYVDISLLALADHRSGIHRVVRSLIPELATNPPPDWRVEPIRYHLGSFRAAHAKTCELLGIATPAVREEVIEFKAGDIFLGLDLAADRLPPLKSYLIGIRARGIAVHFVVYDLLPALHPEWFPDAINSWFLSWLSTVGECADVLICISRAVADELRNWLAHHPPPNGNSPDIKHFHLGADLGSNVPTLGLPSEAPALLESVSARPSFLTVGTIEPRKGHATALAAFEQIWSEGGDANLVIVGPQGWKVEDFVERLASHPEQGRRLFWLKEISDEYLDKLYAASAALIAASEAEGFGLPLVEASRHARPVIASDIPVFREITARSRSIVFFDAGSADGLANAVHQFLQRRDELQAGAEAGSHWITWAESARQLSRAVLGSPGSDLRI